jgi:trans-AT polyketide synthase, acyltransferase and oxidoreductase domains
MRAIVFPGQGSQFRGMGQNLFEEFSEITKAADEILGYSIRELCLEDPHRRLRLTQYTQPALYVVGCLQYLHFKSHTQDSVDFFAGHSVGEYAALFAAEALDFAQGLSLVQRRGELMSSAKDGSMAAVTGISLEQLMQTLKSLQLMDIDLAVENSPLQTVIAGPIESLDFVTKYIVKAGGKLTRLEVSGAFHSRLMTAPSKEFETILDLTKFRPPIAPVISNTSAVPHATDTIAQSLALQMKSTVRWTSCVKYMLDHGTTEFLEMGKRNILVPLIEQTQRHWQTEKSSPNAPVSTTLKATHLGSSTFKTRYNTSYAYYAGAMYKEIASKELVVTLGLSGLLGIYGSGGVRTKDVALALDYIINKLDRGQSFGANLLCNLANPLLEMEIIELYLEKRVSILEASAFMQITKPLVYYRVAGIVRAKNSDGFEARTKIIAKVSRRETALMFLKPPPPKIIAELLADGKITAIQAQASSQFPMADDICVEADSGGHTDMGNLSVLLPDIRRLRDEICTELNYPVKVGLGAAGGIGTAESAAAAFFLGADFIVTGSINQCSVEAGTSDAVKDLLQRMSADATDYAPAGDMFELGAKVQVLKKGLFFPARANRLYELWKFSASWEDIPLKLRNEIETRYFARSFDEVYAETRAYYLQTLPKEIERAEKDPKHKLALVFRWYFIHTMRLSKEGDPTKQVDFQIHCGPACGAFNAWVRGTDLENWRNRHVDKIAFKILDGCAEYISSFLHNGGLSVASKV